MITAQRFTDEEQALGWASTHIPLVAEMPHGGFKHGGFKHGGFKHGGFKHGGFKHSGYGKDLSMYGFEAACPRTTKRLDDAGDGSDAAMAAGGRQ